MAGKAASLCATVRRIDGLLDAWLDGWLAGCMDGLVDVWD